MRKTTATIVYTIKDLDHAYEVMAENKDTVNGWLLSGLLYATTHDMKCTYRCIKTIAHDKDSGRDIRIAAKPGRRQGGTIEYTFMRIIAFDVTASPIDIDIWSEGEWRLESTDRLVKLAARSIFDYVDSLLFLYNDVPVSVI